MVSAYVGLGSNVGDRAKHLENAVALLREAEDVEVVKTSQIYETDPIGVVDQPDFLNAVVELKTSLAPRDLLQLTKSIEDQEKRVRTRRWGPRTVDLDILTYDQLVLDEPDFNLPHPGASDRAFVLVPLAEMAPDMLLAPGRTVSDCLAEVGSSEGVRLFQSQWADNEHS